MTNIDFDKMGGLVPAIIQDATTRKVLMLGFMNNEAYEKTINTGCHGNIFISTYFICQFLFSQEIQ